MKISKATIYRAVAQTTLYLAAKAQGATADDIDRRSTIDDDRKMLDSLFCASARYLTDTLRWAIIAENDTARDYELQMLMPRGVSADTIEGILHQYFTNSVISGWLRMTGDASAAYYADIAAGNIEALRNLYLRPSLRR